MYLDIVVKLVIGYFALILVTRVLGKKEMSQLTSYDIVFAILLGGMIEETLYDDKISILHFLFGISVWTLLSYVMGKLAEKSERVRVLLNGKVSVLVREGKIDHKEMKKNQLEMEQLRALLRTKGIFSMKEVRYVFMETGGQISVMKNTAADPVTPEQLNIEVKDEEPSYMLVDEGRIEQSELENAGKDEMWIKEELNKEGISKIEDIYFAEWTPESGFYIKLYDEKEKDNKKKTS